MSRMLAMAARHQMPHTYTRIPRVPLLDVSGLPVVDEYGDVTLIDGTPVTGERCRYDTRDDLRGSLTPEGATVAEAPRLFVPADDPLAPDDRISDVADRFGTILLLGPIRVAAVNPRAGHGALAEKVADLEGALVV